ncbi:MAG: hypothetical protein OXI96_05765 [Acidimicrobiaceae bacterium]|nr:hypothetical protein [Acidimicrobiaceae bacterium]
MVGWQPQPDDYHRILNEQNPWHSTAIVPAVLTQEHQARLLKRIINLSAEA